MKLLKYILIMSILSIPFIANAQFTDQINSNRPGNSYGAFSVGKKVFQVETGFYGINESHDVLKYYANGGGIELSARYGLLFEQLELVLDGQFQIDKYHKFLTEKNRSGFRVATLGAKYLIYDPFKKGERKPDIYSWRANQKFNWRQLIPAVSAYAGVNYTMENDFSIPGELIIAPKAMLITQNHFGRKMVLITNLIADKITSTNSSYGYVVTLTHGINQKWSAMIENKGVKGDYYSDGIFTLGLTHLLKDNLQIDGSISKNIKETPYLFFGGVGFSWRFDKKHKDPEIKEGKAPKRIKKSKKEKSKAGVLSEEELQKASEKAERKRKKNKNSEIEELDKPVEEKKKRLDDFEEEKEN